MAQPYRPQGWPSFSTKEGSGGSFGSAPSPNAPKSFDAFLGGSALLQGFGALGNSIAQSNAAQLEAEFQKQQFETNARIADINAADALKRGDKAVSQQRRGTALLLGKQRTGFAGQGVKVDSGSAADIQDETKSMSELDQITIKNNAWREAWGYKVQANQLQGQGQLALAAGVNTSNNTLLTGGLSFLRDTYQAGYYFSGGSDPTRRIP